MPHRLATPLDCLGISTNLALLVLSCHTLVLSLCAGCRDHSGGTFHVHPSQQVAWHLHALALALSSAEICINKSAGSR